MARYLTRVYGRRSLRSRRRMYIISASIILLVIIFIFVLRSCEEEQPAETLIGGNLKENREASTAIYQPEPQPMPDLIGDASAVVYEPNAKIAELIAEAEACINANPPRIIEARDRLNELLPMPMSARQRLVVKRHLSKLADKWLFSRSIFPQDKLCDSLQVERGAKLSTIASKFKVPYEILMEINNITRPEGLKAGDTIKVINGPFHARIYRSIFTMDLYLQNTFVRSFSVGLGMPGRETPKGLWVVEPGGKLIRPTWTDPDTGKTYEAEDPDYPLGARWIRLKGLEGDAVGRTGIAFHGTQDASLIGKAGSRGCIRLHNGDVILIYNLLMPGFSQVEVVD